MITINRCNPRIEITMSWGCERPDGELGLYVRRVGDPADFAVYPVMQESGGVLLFQFDDLLFIRPQGRYQGTLMAGAVEYGMVQFDYFETTSIVKVSNV